MLYAIVALVKAIEELILGRRRPEDDDEHPGNGSARGHI